MKKLTLGDWAHIAEVAACVMVVISLTYGIIEYNRQSLIDTSEVDTSLYESIAAVNMLIASNDNLAALVMKVETAPERLTEIERYRVSRLYNVFLNDWEKAFFYHQEGRMDDVTWRNWNLALLAEFVTLPKFVWEDNRDNFPNPDFQSMVDAVSENMKN